MPMHIEARSSDTTLKNVTLRQLRAFLTAAQHLNFGKAARELGLTTQAVSIQIRELESQVGFPLFERRGQGKALSLTATGQFFLGYAQRIFSTLKEAKGAISALRGVDAGHLTVGMVRTTKYIVPLLLAWFREQHPNWRVYLVDGSSAQLQHKLQVGEIDLAIVSRIPHALTEFATPFAEYPLGLVVPPDHPLLALVSVPRQALAQFDFIVREPGSVTRAAFDAYVQQHRIHPRRLVELPNNEAVKQAVMAGLGVGFLSLHTVGLELRTGLVRAPRVQGLPVRRQWFVVRTPARPLSAAAQGFHQFLLRQGDAQLKSHFQAEAMPQGFSGSGS